jgi:hypothetical protein
LLSLNEANPVNFQLVLDEKNQRERQKMIDHHKDAVSVNQNQTRFKALEERARQLEDMLVEKEALQQDCFRVWQKREVEALQKRL